MNKRPIGFHHRNKERMEEMQRKHDQVTGLVLKGFGAFGIIWILSALFSLAVAGGLVYVAWHFISKFW